MGDKHHRCFIFPQISSKASCKWERVKASNAPNGSSSNKSSGFRSRALAIATRWDIPPDNWRGYAFSNPLSFTSEIKSSTL